MPISNKLNHWFEIFSQLIRPIQTWSN